VARINLFFVRSAKKNLSVTGPEANQSKIRLFFYLAGKMFFKTTSRHFY